MEPVLLGEPVVEREREWAGAAARAPAEELEGGAGLERAQARPGNVSVRNAGQQPLTRPQRPVIK